VLVVASTALFAYGTASSGSNGGHDTATSRALEPSIGHDSLMYSASAAHYDRIYSSFKDYAAEAQALAELLRAGGRRTRTVLDVACGTASIAA